MSEPVATVNRIPGPPEPPSAQLPCSVGYAHGKLRDSDAAATGSWLPISSARMRTFCTRSVSVTATDRTGFAPPVPLLEGLTRPLTDESLKKHGLEEIITT